MSERRVVEQLDVIKHICTCLLSGSIDLPSCAFRLERTEKALHSRVIPDLASPAHAACDALFLEQLLEVLAGVLATLVRVVQRRHRFTPTPHSHHQGVGHQLRGHAVVH